MLRVVKGYYYAMCNNDYCVGIKGSGMNSRIHKAPHIYQIDVINGDNFIEELLETMELI